MTLGRAARQLAGVLLIVGGCAKDAPAPEPDVQSIARVDLDSARTVEIIGLRRWTVGMLRDSLKKYAPGEDLDADATAANLRNLLGFADAAMSVHNVVFDEDESTIITLAVREPTDSARVHYAPQSLDTVPERADWRPVTDPLVNDTTGRLLQIVAGAQLEGPSRLVIDSTVRSRRFTHREGYDYESPADSLAARPVLDVLATKNTAADFDAAVRAAASSNSGPDRAAAALILANFPDRDEAWRSLLRLAVGREQARDAFIAQRALVELSERAPRPVDWSPMESTIREVLDGTALAALAPLATALAATGASPAQAAAYLGNGAEMLTALVESDNPDIRDAGHDLLVRLRGQDLGFEPQPWRDCVRTLSPVRP